ncbi:hypothetical protein FRC12_000577 [Ceratobasidium sp. 428]|nr:hypothetical protein FRC12_000577 [Ceratobasidium sp. 428]
MSRSEANRDTQPLIPGPNSLRLFSLDHINTDTRVDLGIPFHEFNIDPSQDLVVLVGVEYSNREPHGWIQFRASTTGQAHPQAAHSVITVELGFETEDATIHNQVELKQDLVAVLFACFAPPARPYEVLIWNWKRGILLNRIGCNNGICSFVFLDANRLALWRARGEHGSEVLDSLDLLVYDKIGSSNPDYDVPDPEKWHIPSSPILSPALTFQFPKLQEASRVKPGGFILLSDYGSGVSFTSSAPFTHSRALTLGLTMSILYDGDWVPLRIFVDTYKLLNHLHKPSQARTLSWNDWGEDSTRWFHADTPDTWIRWSYGSRIVAGGQHISVLDFHTPTVRRFAGRQHRTYLSLQLSQDDLLVKNARIDNGRFPTVLDHSRVLLGWSPVDQPDDAAASEGGVIAATVDSDQPTCLPYFDQPVISRLPYRIITQVHPIETHAGWLISGSHIAGIHYHEALGFSMNRMTVYSITNSNGKTDGP